jgi:hypothetical protein
MLADAGVQGKTTKAVGDDQSVDVPVRQQVNGSTPTGWVQIGTPPKWIYLIFDTGSDKLVAKTWDTVSKELSAVDGGIEGDVVPSVRLYDHNSSSSYHRRYAADPDTHKLVPERSAITYGSGTAITDVGADTITVGQRTLDNFTLMEITRDSLSLLHTSQGIAGILGLQHMKNRSLGHSLFSRLRDAGKMTSFGYCRGKGNNGTMIWGDDSTEGTAMDVLGEMHWAVKLGDVKIANASSLLATGGRSSKAGTGEWKAWPFSDDSDQDNDEPPFDDFDMGGDREQETIDFSVLEGTCADNSCIGILDTGSNIIAAPSKVVKALNAKLDVSPDCSNFDELPPISVVFGGMSVVVQPRGYVMKVPMPDVAPEGSDDGMLSGGDGDAGSALRTVNKHGDVEQAGLAQKEIVDAAAERWRAAFRQLKKNNGVDLIDQLNDVLSRLRNHTTAPQFLCMPALVPLDKTTQHGPLWVVGTPLLDSYYARWSFATGATNPQIHLKKLSDAAVCKEPGDAASSSRVMRKDQNHHSDAHKKKSHQSGYTVIERKIEDIAYPHWAKNLMKV